jgi:opacity protein-like surface antigen
VSLIPAGSLFAGDAGTWYLDADAGINFQQDTFTAFLPSGNPVNPVGETQFRPGERVDLTVGYNANRWLAIELEAGFMHNDISSIGSASVSGVDFNQFPVMLNIVFSRHVFRNWSAFAGGGAGCIVSQWDCGMQLHYNFPSPPSASPGHVATSTDYLFGYQALVGVRYDISRRWDIKLGYKYLATAEGHDWMISGVEVKTDPTMSHSLFATLTYKF